ncbi:MAG: hypothetical protein M3O87_04955 [Candidatus Dormibacteraeota bacterium]|nr:hypothetical protein [Candidatus Dormibacteraeota bacterium]
MFVFLAAIVLGGCAPVITVTNKTTIPVRVVISHSGGSETFAPSPGESSSGDLTEGKYRVVAIPDAAWVDYAKLTRQDLNQQVANSQNLSGQKLLDLVSRLKEIAKRMDEMQRAAGSSAACGGTVTEDRSAAADISIGPSGQLVVACK